MKSPINFLTNLRPAIVRAEIMARKFYNAGAIAFCRNCNPDTGAFGDPTVLKKFGDVPYDLSTL